MVPARDAGFRVVEVALSKNGDMSRAGVQVMYAAVGTVTSVFPSSGAISGGSIVTVTGSGFVAGVTACKFGSSTSVMATVTSTTEARCVSPAGVRGSVSVQVALGGAADSTVSVSSMVFRYDGETSVVGILSNVALANGGTALSIRTTATSDSTKPWCMFLSLIHI